MDENLRPHEFDPLDLGRVDVAGSGLGFSACDATELPDVPDVPEDDPDPVDLSHVVAMFVEGAIVFETGVTAAAPEDAIIEASLDSILTAYDVIEVARAYPNETAADRQAVSRTGELVQLSDRSRIFVIDVPKGDDPEPLAEALRALPFTYFAEIDDPGEPTSEDCRLRSPCPPATIPPCDTCYDRQWSLKNIGQAKCAGPAGTPGADVSAEEAWRITTGLPSTVIAVFDGGVTNDHEDLQGRILPPAPSGPSDPTVATSGVWSRHGYQVSGIIAAHPNNGRGITGVNWGAQIMARRIEIGGAQNSYYCSSRVGVAQQGVPGSRRGAARSADRQSQLGILEAF